LNKEADLVVEGTKLVIRPIKEARAGWNQAFKSMHAKQEDALLIDDSIDTEIKNWEW
jgi:virulence-associated protein VagC